MTAPRAWLWYRVYCGMFAGINLAWVALGAGLVLYRGPVPDPLLPNTLAQLGWLLAVKGALFAPAYALLPRLPRRPWAHAVHFANILFGGLYCVTLPLVVPLALAWRRPETHAFFGDGPGRDRGWQL